ncbi:TPA: hypothetical protein J1245_004703, partial [Escherichia coli]|nr:hypothetical protein [Escherichia coli]
CANNNNCKSGMSVNLANYKFSHEAKVCEENGIYYAFYTENILTQKPPVSLTADFSLISVKDIPTVCKNSNTQNNEDSYALKNM